MLNILLIDSEKEYTKELIDYYKKDKLVNIKYNVEDGREALKIIRDGINEIDIVLLDLFLEYIDGFELIKETIKQGKEAIVLSRCKNHNIIDKAYSIGCSAYLIKPIEFEILTNKFNEIIYEKQSLKELIKDILHEIGMSSKLKGYKYIMESIILRINEVEHLNKIYITISKNEKVSIQSIEKSIRYAIETSCKKANTEFLDKLFSYSWQGVNPTSLEFIETISEYIKVSMRHWLKKYK